MSLIQDILSPGNCNYGMMLEMINTSPCASMIFASRDNIMSELRPKLTIQFESCTPPVATFESTIYNRHVAFTNLTQNGLYWHWDFGDGNFSDLFEPEHDYHNNGTYLVCLTAMNDCDTIQYCDSLDLCPAVLPGFASTLINDTTVLFSNTSGNSNSWFWDFGDGSFSNLENPVRTYSSSGNFLVCLKASSFCDSAIVCQPVNICTTPLAGFTFTILNDSACVFSDNSMNVTGWFWDFGDDNSSQTQNPSHVYQHTGQYTVCLTASNACSSDISCDTIRICYEVRAGFTYTILNDSIVSFNDESVDPVSWHWDFGDGCVSNLQNPVHVYQNSGIYNACCKVDNPCSSGIHCERVEIVIEPPVTTLQPQILAAGSSETGFSVLIPVSEYPTTFVVNDMKGYIVSEIIVNAGTTLVHLPISDKGIYILRVINEEHKHTIKVLVQ